jgi:ABC-type Fe3+ transport system permease subunit
MAETDLPHQRYRRARIWAWITIVSIVFMLLSALVRNLREDTGHNESTSVAWAALTISFLALIVSAVGTASAVLFGWQADRRQTEEARLKIQQLERQLAVMTEPPYKAKGTIELPYQSPKK